MTREIPLPKGSVALVDDADFDWINQWSWHLHNQGYAQRTFKKDRVQRKVLLHRFILRAEPGQLVDHINHDRLDNRRANLRICSARQSMGNVTFPRRIAPYRGLGWSAKSGRWSARIRDHGKQKSLGYFADPIDAARAYDAAAIRVFGEFATLNFPDLAPKTGGHG